MAFDGLVISNLVYELNQTILNAKISKIAQPENDELLFTLKGSNGPVPSCHVRECFAAFSVSDRNKQTQSTDGTKFLYAVAQTYRKRTDHKNLSASHGTYHSF